MKEKKNRLLAGFFFLMILFTFLSKITDSLTVGKVQAEAIKQDALIFKINGVTKVKEKKKQKVKPKEGYIIKDIHVKKGDMVKKGDLLFTYDLKKIKEDKELLEYELKKLELDYKKVLLGNTEGGEEIDLESLQASKQYAKKQLKEAKRKIGRIKEAVKEEKEKLWDEKNEQLETAIDEKKDAEKLLEDEKRKAERTISDYETSLQKLKEPVKQITNLIDDYIYNIINKNYTKVEDAKYNIFNYYYDKNYEAHLKEIETARLNYERALEDENDMEAKWKEIIDPSDQNHEDEAVREQYKNNIRARKEERKAAERAIEDAKEVLDTLKKKDLKLYDMLAQLRLLVEQNPNSSAVDKEKNDIFIYLCKGNIKEDLEEEIKKAELEIVRAKEDKEKILESGKESIERKRKKIKKLEEEKEKIERDLEKIKNNLYNYQPDLEETKEMIEEKEKALNDIELQIKNMKKNISNQEKAQDKNKKINQIELQRVQLDMEEKKKAIKDASDLLNYDGQVYSPMNGKVLLISFDKESTITSQDKLMLSVKGFLLSASVLEEELKYFDEGDKLKIIIDEKNQLEVVIEEIKKPENNKQVFIMNIPETFKAVKEGDEYEFTGEKQSVSYRQCISLGALKEDTKGSYVLIIQTKEGVLGKEEIAVRRNVTIIEQDYEKAAIESDLSNEDKVIVGSNKNISIGDRVRVEEE